MKKLVTIVLCALFAIHAAEARTLYVNANAKNNNGNALKLKTAKKTIQAAINIAKEGDTILVYPGNYAPIKTKNKKITIKAKSGKSKTTLSSSSWWTDVAILDLGNGTATKFVGFTITPFYDRHEANYGLCGGAKGGNIQNCDFISVGAGSMAPTFLNSKLSVCAFDQCYASTGSSVFAKKATMNRCTVSGVYAPSSLYSKFASCNIYNSLITGVGGKQLSGCVLVNDTVANNYAYKMSSTKAYNTIFYKVDEAQFKASRKNKFSHCYKGNSPKFTVPEVIEEWDEEGYSYYETPTDYHLLAGSPCINSGKLSAAQKKAIGTKDLDGKKRIKGKAVDKGCYEY